MSALLRELTTLCAEIRSEKLTTRNKASERLDNILTNSKADLFVLFQNKSLSNDISWTDLFNSAIHATFKHSAKLEESQDSRSAQSMRNKNHVYTAIVTKLVDYSLEDRNNFLSKSTLLTAFFDGFSIRSVLKCFGTLFLYVLETGIYKYEDNVNDLKVNEFSRILSYLFEVNTDSDENLRFAVLRATNRTIELSERNVQLTADLIDYLPEVKVYACSAVDDRRKAEVIKLFHMCIKQLSLDYHISVCTNIQEVLPTICAFYNFRMRTEVKETFFTSVVISLTAIYPHIRSSHCNPINLTLSQHWDKTLKKIETIIETEIKERRTQLYRSGDVVTKRCFEVFIEMSALIVYLKYWHNKSDMEDLEDVMESRRKIQKVADNIEVILGFVQTQVPPVNETWLAILAELLNTHHHLINSNNYQEVLETIFQILCVFTNVDNLKYVKICILSLLRYEQDLKEKNIPTNFCDQIWTKIIEFVLSDTSTNSDVINEKQLLLQSLIIHNKLSLKEINMLLQSFLINKTMKRTECIATIRQILINADCIGLDKTSELVGSVLKWICVSDGKIDAKSVLLNIEPIDFDLIADTIAIAAINFLNESKHLKKSKITDGVSRNLMLLLYKYNRKYVCIEEHGSEMSLMSLNHKYCDDEIKNCLFQSNYELIMRELNFATTKETSPIDILLDLSHLQKLVCLMNRLFKYKVFSEDNYSQCPLMKRIGFFLSHLEFQLKNNDPKCIDRNDLLDILHRIKGCFIKFTSNTNLLNYLESQPLEELISFVDKTLIFSVSRNIRSEFEDFGSITCLCLEILAILCGSISHYKDAFVHILKHKLAVKDDFSTLIVLIKIFCTQKQEYPEVATWFVDKLKTVCQLYHNNKEISTSIVELLPAIFKYVRNQDEPLQNMLIILSSLLKKTYKKSYSTRFGAKLMESIRLISQNCAGNSIHIDFRNICMSVTKFISSSSLEVQFAAINTITALMDFKWFCAVAEPSDLHLDFCEDLMAQIDYKNLSTTTLDTNLNSISVTTQLLVSIFVFSSYHQETAIEELSYFCALRKLTESNFFQFQQIAAYFDCSLSELTTPYVPKLVQKWTENKYPISKLPYFLCSNEKENFYAENISTITTCILLHYKVNELKKLENYKAQGELIELSIPSMLALIVSFKAGCWSADKSNSSNYIENLIKNLNLLGVDLSKKAGTNAMDWRTLFHILELYSDACDFQKMFGFSLCSLRNKWYNIDYESLLKCLRYYISNYCMIKEKNECLMFSLLISKHSLILVRVLTALKEKTCNSVFLIDKLKSFHVYCTFSKLIIDSIESDTTNISRSQSSKKYFIRDVIYYLLYILQDSIDFPMLQCAALTIFQQILSLSVVSIGFYSEILKSNLNYIIKALVSSAKRNTHEEVRQSSINAIYLVINHCKEQLNDALAFLDDLPISENSNKLRLIQKPMLLGEAKDLTTIIKSFLETQNRGTECLIATRNYISNNKSQLPLENSLINDFIKRLIEITCNSSNEAFTMEAAKCLGEIGALKLNGFSYYFETDISFYRTESVQKDPMEYFTECLLNTVESILLNYNKKTFLTVCLVCEQLVNSRNGIKILNSLSYLNVFHHDDSHRKNYLNSSITMESIDVLTMLQNTVLLSYEQWICNFVSKLYSFLGWADFEELCCCDTIFAESSLIPLFKILVSKKDVHLVNILAMLDYFFNEVFTAINRNTLKLATIYKEKRIIKHFLDICECVRISNEWNLPVVNLLYVAKACNYCQAYFLAILYLEMWSVQEKNKESRQTSNDIISNELFQEVSLKAYESIGCCDAISGFLNPIKSRLEFLNIEGTWSDVLLHADATGLSYNAVYVSNLKKNGLLYLANLNQNTKSIDYEICWRLCQWDTIVEGHAKINTLNDMEQEFKKHHFNSLKCIYKREEINSLAAITNARNCVVSILKEISLECLHSVYKYLTWLQILQQVEDFCQVQFTSSSEVVTIFEKWKIEAELEYGNFFCKEQILSHQATLFKTAGIRANRKIKEYYQDTDPLELYLLKCIKSCIHAGEMNLASRNIAVLKNMKLSNEHIQVNVLLKDAEVCLKIGKSLITKAILEHLIKNKEFAFCLQRVKAYRMYGEYLMESNTETFETVLSKYFKGSIDLLNQFDKNKDKILLKNPNLFQHGSFIEFEQKNRKQAYESMAKYADREYTQLNIYSNSDAFQMKCKIIQENRQAADLIGKQNKDRDKNIGAIFMKKFANLDEKEILSVKQKRTDNLCIAIESYMKFCIIDQAITSPAIYRIIALWFANKQNESLHSKIAKDIGEIPSYKFLCALNQMTARLNSKNQDFLLLLRDILVRCAQDHPHHTLYQLFPLVNAFSDSSNSTGNDRVSIAKDIINRSKNKLNSVCIKQLETMFPALIDFANEKTSENKISISENLRRLKNLDAVQCPTVELTVAISKSYNITSVVKWEDKVVLVGGINAPKKLTCLCSDGIKRSQLLKAKDDLRQDAVMQQVFSMINDLLRSETETNQRKLKLRTYKVVPLSMRSGILEWCQNTIPIGVYLSGDGKNGAHKKYRPNDYTIQKCRSLSMQHLKSDADKRLQIYMHICSNIQPVLHYFFFEKFLVPGEWFERRLAYINSVATTSIVGFVLGLGDRHTQNILIDERTAEVIHIDFGIAFEQGKIMPTPETVPFRLTRDMVAPMGVCETNGLFKKSCETMMRTLRRNQAVITTILEVLLFDPLYIWKVVPQAVDDCSSEQTNLTAQRALLCVQNKLEGKQTGIFGISEIDVQVQRLINDAILSQNLCLLYPGWDPYL